MMSVCLLIAPLAAPLPGHVAAESAVRLDVRAMAAPKPALKYQLLPEVRELTPGNPVQWYLRCFAEQRNFFFDKQAAMQRSNYRTMPLAELPVKELRTYGGSALTQADWGARLDTPDWSVLERLQSDGMDLRSPELDPLWILATGLQVRFRAEIAGGYYDDAIRTAKTMLTLARHLGEYPTSRGNLLGVAVAQLALDSLEEMIQQPGCPNLYWALTNLPCPLVELRKGFQGDCVMVAAELRGLHDDHAMTSEELEEVVSKLSGRLAFVREQAGRPPRGLRATLAERVKDQPRIVAARNRLLDRLPPQSLFEKLFENAPAVRVMSLPDLQILLLDEQREYEERRDAEMTLLALAPWQIDAMKEANRGDGLLVDFLPRVAEARIAQARLEQRIGLLRHVEALRMYAASHGGKLPQTLDAIGVPLPTDPFTGKPFAYTLDGATARLQCGTTKGDEKASGFHPLYEVVIRK